MLKILCDIVNLVFLCSSKCYTSLCFQHLQQSTIAIQTLPDKRDDVIILPLSPEPENRLQEATVLATYETQECEKTVQLLQKHQTVLTTTQLNIPDKRMKKHSRVVKSNTKIAKNNNSHKTQDQNSSTSNKKHKTVRATKILETIKKFSFFVFIS